MCALTIPNEAKILNKPYMKIATLLLFSAILNGDWPFFLVNVELIFNKTTVLMLILKITFRPNFP